MVKKVHDVHMHVCNAVTLVWGLLRLTTMMSYIEWLP